MIEAGLIVPELEARAGLHQRQDGAGVAVTTGQGQRAASPTASAVELGAGLVIEGGVAPLATATGGVAATIERDLDEAAGIGETDLELAVHTIAAGSLGAALDHAADVTTEPHRRATRVEVDLIDEVRVDDRGPDRHVEQDRHAHAVEEVAGVARRRAAHDHVGEKASQLRGARQALDHAKRIAEGPGQRVDLVVAQGRAGDRHLALLADDRAIRVAVEVRREAILVDEVLLVRELHLDRQIAKTRGPDHQRVLTRRQPQLEATLRVGRRRKLCRVPEDARPEHDVTAAVHQHAAAQPGAPLPWLDEARRSLARCG